MDSSLKYSDDLYVSSTITSKEIEARRGKVYRFSSGFITLTSDNYFTMSGMTPPTGTIIYTSANINKSGDELKVLFMEGGTYESTGSSVVTGRNLNRSYNDQTPAYPLTKGFYAAGAGTTITGALPLVNTLIGGTGSEASQTGD